MLTSGGKNTDIAVQHVGAGEAVGPRYTPITATKSSVLNYNKKPKQKGLRSV